MNKNALIALLTTSALAATTGAAYAVPNVAFVNVAAGNTFNTDLNTAPDSTGSNTLFMAATGGTGNDTYIGQAIATNSLSNTSQYGSGNKAVAIFKAGNNNKVNTFQGNSPEQAAINKFAVATASNSVAVTTVGGDNQTFTTVQKGEQNVALSTVQGASSNALIIQEMRDIANGDIIDNKGNHYKGGNDSVVNAVGGKHNITVNQYNGNVSKVNIDGDSINANVKQVNAVFDFNRKYNNVSNLTQKGVNLSANIDQTGAGELSTVSQLGNGISANVTQRNGGGNATITQEGEQHSATIGQTADSSATITQGGKGHTTGIGQIGGKNVATAAISGLNNQAALGQEGDTNTVTATQKNGANNVIVSADKGVSNRVTISQDGSGNSYTKNYMTKQEFTVVGSNNVVSLAQLGDNNLGGYFISGNGNSVTNNQTGNNNTAQSIIANIDPYTFVVSAPSYNSNTLVTTQNGNGNVAGSVFRGNSNNVNILQTGNNNVSSSAVWGGDNNVSKIQQVSTTGEGNFLDTAYGVSGNAMTITQTGANAADFGLSTNNSTLTISQANDGTRAHANSIHGSAAGNNNKIAYVQNGSNNRNHLDTFTAEQLFNEIPIEASWSVVGGDNNQVSLTQAGNNNVGYHKLQGSNTTHSTIQTGDNNVAAVYTTAGLSGGTTLTQIGGGNNISVTQNGTGATVVAPQNGNGNKMTVTQNSSVPNGVGVNGTTTSYSDHDIQDTFTIRGVTFQAVNPALATWQGQKGDNNTVTVNQSGSSAIVRYQQIGNGNTHTVTLDNVRGGWTRSNQLGNNNTATIYQSGNSGTDGVTANLFDSYQQGDNNIIRARQVSTVVMSGANAIYNKQIGNGNVGDVLQTGTASALLTSNGNFNTISITQDNSGSNPLSNRNIASVVQNGSSNRATVNQTGNGNTLNLTQQGSGLNYSVTQTGGQNVLLTQTHN